MSEIIEMFYDGACEPVNPGGFGGAGVVIKKNGERIHEFSRNLGSGAMSNNVAEYAGMIEGLTWLLANGHQDSVIHVFGDNMMSVMQMKMRWKAKKGIYLPWYVKALQLRKKFKRITFTWIPREKNEEADEMSKKALKNDGIKFRIQKEGGSNGL